MELELPLFGFLLAMAVVIARSRDLFGAAMLFGIFSLICAALFTLMDAVDVAFTEAAIGAGISTVLILSALSLTRQTEEDLGTRAPLGLLVVTLTGAALIYGTLDMPAYGSADAPIHQRTTPYYLTVSAEEIGVPNVVTSILASYRSYDTFGELTVIFTAGIGVLLVLGHTARGGERDRRARSKGRKT
jgi:multicomponent Na+:H+ antiporter subunit B